MAKLPNRAETIKASRDFGAPMGLLEVELRRWWSAADQEYLTNRQLTCQMNTEAGMDKAKPDISVTVARIDMAERVLAGWNVEGEKGEALPVERQYIEQLPSDCLEWILEEWEAEQDRQKKASG